MTDLRFWRHFDYVLLAATIALVALGVVLIHSATRSSLDESLLSGWRRQAIVGAAGVGLIFLLAAFPRNYQWLGDFWWLAYLLAAVLLVLVLLFGRSEIGNVHSWLNLGAFSFQPSYVAMLLLSISVGAVLSRQRKKRQVSKTPLFGAPKTSLLQTPVERPGFGHYVAAGLMTLTLAALVFLQPDMATAVVFVFMWAAMVLESDMPLRYLVLTALVGLAALYPLWRLTELLGFEYIQKRVTDFFSPEPDYQVTQALIAIGSGGLWGRGLGHGPQSQLRYLPVRHTDFIFAVAAEELGFAGVVLLFALYLVLFFRLLRIILIAPDTFGRLLVTSVLAMILFQLVVNVGMNMGLLPVAGLPMPLVSYGPTALLTVMAGIGIAENVAVHRRPLEF